MAYQAIKGRHGGRDSEVWAVWAVLNGPWSMVDLDALAVMSCNIGRAAPALLLAVALPPRDEADWRRSGRSRSGCSGAELRPRALTPLPVGVAWAVVLLGITRYLLCCSVFILLLLLRLVLLVTLVVAPLSVAVTCACAGNDASGTQPTASRVVSKSRGAGCCAACPFCSAACTVCGATCCAAVCWSAGPNCSVRLACQARNAARSRCRAFQYAKEPVPQGGMSSDTFKQDGQGTQLANTMAHGLWRKRSTPGRKRLLSGRKL